MADVEIPPQTPGWGIDLTRNIAAWVRRTLDGPIPSRLYSIASMPATTGRNGATIALSDGLAGRPIATAINGVWKYADGTSV